MLRRPESSERRKGSERTTGTWSLTMPSRWSLVRLSSALSFCRLLWLSAVSVRAVSFHSALPVITECVQLRSAAQPPCEQQDSRFQSLQNLILLPQCSLYPVGWPWQLCCVRTMGAVSCSCFLFPVSVSWYYSPKRKLVLSAPPSPPPRYLLSDAAPCNPLYGPVWPFIKTSQHLGSLVVRCPITCSPDLSFHHSIVLTKRVTQ